MSRMARLAAAGFAALLLILTWSAGAFATPPETPIKVDLSIAHAPRLNEWVGVKVKVRAIEAAPNTKVELVLPAGVRASRNSWTVDLKPNVPVTLTSTVSSGVSGNIAVSARAIKAKGGGVVWGDMKSIPLNIGAGTSKASRLGWDTSFVPIAEQVAPGDATIVSRAPVPFDFAAELSKGAGVKPPSVEPSLKPAKFVAPVQKRGTVTLTGTWRYTDRAGVSRPVDQQLVEIRKGDGSALSPRVFCYTNSSGNYSCSFAHPGTTMQVWLRSWTSFNRPGGTDRLGVFSGIEVSGGCGSDDINCSYPSATPAVSCADGTSCNVGTWLPSAGAEPWQGAHWMEQDLIKSWKRIFFDTKHGTGVTSGPARITYPVPSGHGTHAHVPPGDGWISIEPPNQQSASISVHEYGHVVMANLWGGFSPNWPTSDCPSPHFVTVASGPGCALSEGWGDFWAWYGTGDPVFRWPSGATANMETRDNNTFGSGDQVEGNVAAIFGDMFDSANDGPFSGNADRLADGVQHIWHTTSTQSDRNLAEWWAAYLAFGHAPCPALEVFRYNTVNYSHSSCPNFTVSVSSSPPGGGATTGSGTWINGTSRSVQAFPSGGYTFLNWTEGSTSVSTSTVYNFTLSSNRTLVANFQRVKYTLAVSAQPTKGGTVSGGGTFDSNTSRTVEATPKKHYKFVRWTESGTEVSTSNSYTFTLTGNRTLVAKFKLKNYKITVSAKPTNGGTVSGGGTFTAKTSRTVKATPKPGFQFVKWTENGNSVSTSKNYTFSLTKNRNLVAQFKAKTEVSALDTAGAE